MKRKPEEGVKEMLRILAFMSHGVNEPLTINDYLFISVADVVHLISTAAN